MTDVYFLVQFSSSCCKYLSLKFWWSEIKFWSTLVHTTLTMFTYNCSYQNASSRALSWHH